MFFIYAKSGEQFILLFVCDSMYLRTLLVYDSKRRVSIYVHYRKRQTNWLVKSRSKSHVLLFVRLLLELSVLCALFSI